ncbi:hypothetical protein N7474_007935 [Penicillium riverlandense]|uniref:uncharacterized protein n=1 Tax=Penicillium riverlandense TaxID=1903569 RepID=UPI002547A224|nr:uncharacterized protein N7474_007935 [Penicillium riverlandense]KAJ5811634.1 hypothetical protein N7474_007935 [Penicillium riverlandense]
MPADSKTKSRPQQSCLKCRERKVKVSDRGPNPLIVLMFSTVYLTTAEDRVHINMAETIERLRREVEELRSRHNQPAREPSEGSRSSGQKYSCGESGYAHYSHSHAGGEGAEGSSRPGSSPSSPSTMTNSRTVASPDSTGSDGGVTGFPQHYYSVPTHPYVAELDASVTMAEASAYSYSMDTPTPTILSSYTGGMPGLSETSMAMSMSMSMPHMPPAPTSHAYGIDNADYNPQAYKGEQAYNEDSSSWYHSNTSLPHAYPNHNPPSTFHANPELLSIPPALHSHLYNLAPTLNTPHQTPSSWKGRNNQELLETLLDTIGSCDEQLVAQVVHVVRASPTPEDAVSGICQVLGIGRPGQS